MFLINISAAVITSSFFVKKNAKNKTLLNPFFRADRFFLGLVFSFPLLFYFKSKSEAENKDFLDIYHRLLSNDNFGEKFLQM